MTFMEVLANPFVVAIGPAIIAGVVALAVGRQKVEQVKAQLKEKNDALVAEKKRTLQLVELASQKDEGPEKAEASRQTAVELLKDIIEETAAERATLYTPLEGPDGRFLGLVVLATAPSDLASSAFEGTVFSSREASAVKCFLSRQPTYAESSRYRYDDYSPDAMYADIVAADRADKRESPYGVVQILTKNASIDQNSASLAMSKLRGALTEICGGFVGDNQPNLRLVGLRMPAMSSRGSVMVFDISNSADLFFSDQKSAAVVDFLNAFSSRAYQLCASRGGVFEGFTGDGFVFAFPSAAHGNGQTNVFENAVLCARDIIAEFPAVLNSFRADLDATGRELHPRAGIASGIIHPIYLSADQMRVSSIVGRTPSTAGTICNCGRRDRPDLLIDSATLAELDEPLRSRFAPISDDQLTDKARRHAIKIYTDSGG